MPKETVEYHLNKTQNVEVELPCLKCAGKTIHKASVTVDTYGSGYSYVTIGFDWSIHHQIVQCLGCKSLSFRIASPNAMDHYQGVDEIVYGVSERLYPPRIEGQKGLGRDTTYLPAKVRPIYDETLIALSVQAPILAAIGLRALIEAVCQEKKAKGGDLLKRIDRLVELQVLTSASATILHRIRALGNAAAHEAKPHSDRQLALAMDIVEHMLKAVYILPKQAESEFEGGD